MSQKLLETFIALRERAEKDTLNLTYAQSNLFHFLSHERKAIFDAALSTWRTAFASQPVLKQISQLSQDNHKDRKAIKLLRKQGVILSSAYAHLDDRKLPPEHHAYFMRKIGKLNDPLSPEAFALQREKARAAAVIYGERTTHAFVPISDEAYFMGIEGTLQELTMLFAQSLLNIEAFHDGRQQMRELMNLLQVHAVLNQNQKTYENFKNWYLVNSLLGEVNDQALVEAGGVKEIYQTKNTVLDSDLQNSVFSLLTR